MPLVYAAIVSNSPIKQDEVSRRYWGKGWIIGSSSAFARVLVLQVAPAPHPPPTSALTYSGCSMVTSESVSSPLSQPICQSRPDR